MQHAFDFGLWRQFCILLLTTATDREQVSYSLGASVFRGCKQNCLISYFLSRFIASPPLSLMHIMARFSDV